MIDTITQASKSVVSIIISKDMKFYMEDPSNVTGPWNVQAQSAKVWGWSWIIFSKDGYILTNKHVVEDTAAEYRVVTNDGKEHVAKVLARDPAQDLAILKKNWRWENAQFFFFLPNVCLFRCTS